MSPDGDITQWIRQMKAGERQVVQHLWQGYFQRLVDVARRNLVALPRPARDASDVALSAFDSFIRGAEQGRFPKLEDRDDLWQLLVVITKRKAADRIAFAHRDRRDCRRHAEDEDGSLLRGLLSREPDPAFEAQVGEECQRLLACLRNDELRQIAVRKMEGFTNEEIAEQFGIALASVGRRLALIRDAWIDEANRPQPEFLSQS
jgi:DNA-directed RNA polymerase specialized sigma24 family protein